MLDYLANLPHGSQLLGTDSALSGYIERMRTRESGVKVLLPMASKKN